MFFEVLIDGPECHINCIEKMKKEFSLIMLFAAMLAACGNDRGAGADSAFAAVNDGQGVESSAAADVDSLAPAISFAGDKFDFGQIKQGEQVSHVFEFTNTGKKPLIISNVMAGCGCTTPKFDRKPIPPGQKGKIEVGYNSAGQSIGKQQKIISVQSNAKDQAILHLTGEVTN